MLLNLRKSLLLDGRNHHIDSLASRRFKGTYAFTRLIPFVDLYQEYKATQEAIGYLKEVGDHPTELSAYKILYPAYGTYVGSYLFPPIGTVGGALIGHAAGRSQATLQAHHYQHEAPPTPTPSSEPEPVSATP